MTEAELTKIAMKEAEEARKKAQEQKAQTRADIEAAREEVMKKEAEKAKQAPKTPPPPMEPKSKTKKIKAVKNDYTTVELSKNKTVHLKPWTGKTKKRFKKVFEGVSNMEDVDFREVLEILIYKQSKEDLLFQEAEQQYLLVKLRESSIGEEIQNDVPCPSCGLDNSFKMKTSDLNDFEPDQLPFDYSDEIRFENCKKTEAEENIQIVMNQPDYDGLTSEMDVEFASRIKIKGKGIVEVIDFIDDMKLSEQNDLITTMNDHMSKFSLTVSHVCEHCKTEQRFPVDVITGVFEALAK